MCIGAAPSRGFTLGAIGHVLHRCRPDHATEEQRRLKALALKNRKLTQADNGFVTANRWSPTESKGRPSRMAFSRRAAFFLNADPQMSMLHKIDSVKSRLAKTVFLLVGILVDED
jgi:hypothetical protein